jgi:hypothetical protein
MTQFIPNGLDNVLPKPPAPRMPLQRALVKAHRAAGTGTMPRWMCRDAGAAVEEFPRCVDRGARPRVYDFWPKRGR